MYRCFREREKKFRLAKFIVSFCLDELSRHRFYNANNNDALFLY